MNVVIKKIVSKGDRAYKNSSVKSYSDASPLNGKKFPLVGSSDDINQ